MPPLPSTSLVSALSACFPALPDAPRTLSPTLLEILSAPAPGRSKAPPAAQLSKHLASLGRELDKDLFQRTLSSLLASPPPSLAPPPSPGDADSSASYLAEASSLLSAASSEAILLAKACRLSLLFLPPPPPSPPPSPSWLDRACDLSLWEQAVACQERQEQQDTTARLLAGGTVSVASNSKPVDLAHTSSAAAASRAPPAAAGPTAASLSRDFQALKASLTLLLSTCYRLSPAPARTSLLASLLSHLSRAARRLGSHHTAASLSVHRHASQTLRSTLPAPLPPLLSVLSSIISGLASPPPPALLEALLALHEPMGHSLHRDQKSLLSAYHLPLTRCLHSLIERGLSPSPSFASAVLLRLGAAEVWPAGATANTDKEVLLLEELECLVTATAGTAYAAEAVPVGIRRAAESMRSDNSRVAERALQFFKNPALVALLAEHITLDLMRTLVAALCGGLAPSWNPTVNKMTFNVLSKLREMDRPLFEEAAETRYGGGAAAASGGESGSDDDVASDEETKRRVRKISLKGGGDAFSIPAAVGAASGMSMGARATPGAPNPNPFLLPTGPGGRGMGRGRGAPPATITGVAPWAVSGGGKPKYGKNNQPPVTVTGVAPWAMSGGGRGPTRKQPRLPSFSETKEHSPQPSVMSGVEKVEAYLAAIKPADADSKHSSWSVDQLRATPTLLPNLRFHDLVFGKELGSGAFSTVKYARRINKSSTRSKWSEYGVKIISRSKIEELGYSRSVEREIACLRILANPNIARLVSEFRFRDGAYLVLEYASNGDLHTLIFDNGSLDDDSAQFVMGEVLAALSSIHDAGFMFGDLKPENVLITEAGHIKLGDFGGCRAVTEDAKRLLRESTSAVEDLRDGDWRAAMKGGGWGGEEKGGDEEMKDVGEEKGEEKGGGGEEEVDDRVEGTPAYMSPEAAAGVRPTRASDMWSFGCVLFACIAGRPPIIDHDEAATVSKIVKFASDDGEFFGEDKDIFSAGAIELIESCCSVAADARPTCEQAAGFRWFKGANVHNLYLGEAPDLGAGKVKKGEVDESWTRRQHSSIWSPQPERYTFGADAAGAGGGKGGGVEGFDALVAMAIREAEGGEGEAMDVVVVGEGEDEKEGGSEAMPPPRRASRALEGVRE